MQRLCAFLFLAGTIAAAGCGGSDRPDTFPVEGTVTYRGQSVAEAYVRFIPENAPPASGQTDAAGKFTLETFEPGDGAAVGEHVVLVSKTELADPNDKSSYPEYRPVLPQHYGQATKSPLRATVTADGENQFVFDLVD